MVIDTIFNIVEKIKIEKFNSRKVTTTKNLSFVFGLSNDHVLFEIRNCLKKWDKIGMEKKYKDSFFMEHEFIDENNEKQITYFITERGVHWFIYKYNKENKESYINIIDAYLMAFNN